MRFLDVFTHFFYYSESFVNIKIKIFRKQTNYGFLAIVLVFIILIEAAKNNKQQILKFYKLKFFVF